MKSFIRVITSINLILTFVTLMPASAHAAPLNFFVATNGSDKNPGTLQKPFKTIQHCVSSRPGNSTCNVRAGNYFETVVPTSSGLTVQSYNNEKVTLDSRKSVTGFKQYAPNKYVAKVTLPLGDDNQIFFNDTSGILAMWPNTTDLLHPNWERIPNEISPENLLTDSQIPSGLSGTGSIKFFSGDDAWTSQTGSFDNPQSGNLHFTLDGASTGIYITPAKNGLYYLFNNIAFLDTAYEWFYNPTESKLFVQIPSGSNINSFKISYKSKETLVDLRGSSHETIKNISLFGGTIAMDEQSQGNLIDGINANYVSNSTRSYDNTTTHNWAGGFSVDHLFDTGIMVKGKNEVLRNSVISNSSCNGVVVAGSDNSVTNNLITNTNSISNDCGAIALFGTRQSITHNTIANTGRMGILLLCAYNQEDNPNPGDGPTNSQISYNDIFNFGTMSVDIGGVYLSGSVNTGLVIDHNWIHSSAYPSQIPISQSIPNTTVAGIYFDWKTSDATAYQNVMWDLASFPFWVNRGDSVDLFIPANLGFYNNTIVNSDKGKSMGLLGPYWLCGSTNFSNNRVSQPTVNMSSPSCPETNDNSSAPGATEMVGITPGCTLTACKIDPYKPPALN